MNSAVLSSYSYNGGPNEGSPEAPFPGLVGAARMAKRKRGDVGDYSSPEEWQQPSQSHPHGPTQQYGAGSQALVASTFGSSAGGVEYASSSTNIGVAPQDNAGASALADTADPTQQWSNNSSASRYPDVMNYAQQPYFFQQTDPSTYNSPWPPAETTAFGSQTSSYSVPPPTTTMPYFPTQTVTQQSESALETAVVPQPSYQNYSSEIEAPSQYAYVQQPGPSSQARGDVASQTPAFLYEDASMHLKIQSLPILENLATQLIHTIAKASFPQVQEIMRGSETEDSQAYTTLKNLFDQTRKVYSRETPFIDAIAIQMFQPNQQEIIRKANIATFISSILGAHDVSFFHLNEFFMETFVPLGHRLLKWQGAIYLELKTQTYISALINSDGNPQDMLDELFPSDLDAQILTRHPDAPSLSPSEQDFIDRSRQRKQYLLAEESTEEALRELPKKYQWQDFVREFATCISKNVDGIMNVPARAQPVFGSSASDRRSGNAAQALQDTLGRSNSIGGSAAKGVQSLSLNGQGGQSGQRDSLDGSRKSAAATSTIRQPWTKPEEDALLSGLERVNGPHWSQILALYGRGGSISEVLKDRNQVQLKDKARNLKLWYLKTGKEVPQALRGVTGELRKRGGARARAALGLTEEQTESGDNDADAEGEVDDVIEVGVDRAPAARKGSAKKKTKKGS